MLGRGVQARPTLTSPNGGSVVRGVPTTVAWTVPVAVSTGSFRLALKSTVGGFQQPLTKSNISAIAGTTQYTAHWNVTQAVGSSYRLWVYYSGSNGKVISSDISDGTLLVTAPSPSPTPTSPPTPTPTPTANTYADADTHADADADTNTHADTDADTHADADTNTHADADTNTHADADTNTNAHTDADTNTNAHTDADTNANTHADADTNTNAHTEPDRSTPRGLQRQGLRREG